MITDHQKTTSEIKGMVDSKTVNAAIPPTVDSAHKARLDKLSSLNGADFTKQYHDDQVSAHKDAVSLFQRYAKGGRNVALKNWAAKTEPTLEPPSPDGERPRQITSAPAIGRKVGAFCEAWRGTWTAPFGPSNFQPMKNGPLINGSIKSDTIRSTKNGNDYSHWGQPRSREGRTSRKDEIDIGPLAHPEKGVMLD
jgi:hypothetical protein